MVAVRLISGGSAAVLVLAVSRYFEPLIREDNEMFNLILNLHRWEIYRKIPFSFFLYVIRAHKSSHEIVAVIVEISKPN